MTQQHLPRLFLAFLFASLLSFPLFASTVVGSGTPASCTEASLDSAITEANGTFGIVTFNCGPSPHTMLLTGEKGLATGVIVDGGDKITLSGGNSTRLFNIFQGAAVDIRNINLVNGFAAAGGCLLAVGSNEKATLLALNRVSFSNCRATNYGGAVAAADADLTVVDSPFDSNLVDLGGGGAISLNSGNIDLLGSTFTSNQAIAQGGALQIWFSTATLNESTFSSNEVAAGVGGGNGGGAVMLRGSSATSNHSVFASNTSFDPGGAILATDSSGLLLEDGYLYSNQALPGYGGGLYVDSTSSANLSRTTLSANQTGSDGGAVYSLGALTIRNATISGNGSITEGPGIFIGSSGSLDMVSATLVDNSSFTQAATTGQLAWTAGNTITVHNSLFTDLSLGSRACAGPLPASFSFSIWRGTSCGNSTANGNQPSTWAIVARIGRSCGGLAPDLTPTHRALYSDAESIDTGSCRIGDPMTDQRGVARAQGIACDVGATEFLPACDQPLFSDDFEIASTQNWSLTVP